MLAGSPLPIIGTSKLQDGSCCGDRQTSDTRWRNWGSAESSGLSHCSCSSGGSRYRRESSAGDPASLVNRGCRQHQLLPRPGASDRKVVKPSRTGESTPSRHGTLFITTAWEANRAWNATPSYSWEQLRRQRHNRALHPDTFGDFARLDPRLLPAIACIRPARGGHHAIHCGNLTDQAHRQCMDDCTTPRNGESDRDSTAFDRALPPFVVACYRGDAIGCL